MKTDRRGYIYTPSSYSSGRYTRRYIRIEGYSPGGRIDNLRRELHIEEPLYIIPFFMFEYGCLVVKVV